MFNLYLLCSLFSFQLFIMFRLILPLWSERLFLHVVHSLAFLYYKIFYGFSYLFNMFLETSICHFFFRLMRFSQESSWKFLRLIEIFFVRFIIHECHRTKDIPRVNSIILLSISCSLFNSLKSILSQIKNLFHSISKTVLNHPVLTRVSVLHTQNDSVECLVCAYIKSISFDFPEL